MSDLPLSKPAALILCLTNLHKDPRVLRQISWLKDGYAITTLGLSPSNVEGVEHIQYDEGPSSPPIRKLRRVGMFFSRDYDRFYWNANRTSYVKKLSERRFDLIVANDYDTLPIGVRVHDAHGSTLVFDAHEYSPLEFPESWRWRLLKQPLIKYICREYIPRSTVAITVCKSIAETYERDFGKKFEIITNAPAFQDLKPSPTRSEKIRLIYHGGVSPARQTDKQIEMMRFLDDRYELNLMLTGDTNYIEKLKTLAGPLNNVKFLPPVATADVVGFTNQFDIGIYSLPPTNFNNQYALPNKFFEFIQARLAIVIGPSIEMAGVVRDYDLGIVTKDFTPQSIAQAVKGLSVDKINYFKAQAHKHAYELSAEENRKRFFALLKNAGK